MFGSLHYISSVVYVCISVCHEGVHVCVSVCHEGVRNYTTRCRYFKNYLEMRMTRPKLLSPLLGCKPWVHLYSASLLRESSIIVRLIYLWLSIISYTLGSCAWALVMITPSLVYSHISNYKKLLNVSLNLILWIFFYNNEVQCLVPEIFFKVWDNSHILHYNAYFKNIKYLERMSSLD